jgi:ribosome biogenesis GTPase / thiamine phosphate phosphatase
MISLAALGWDDAWKAAADEVARPELVPARIAIEHRGAYEALGADAMAWAELRGRDYFVARDKRELPTVGDWVLLAPATGGVSVIEALLPRRSVLVRAAAGDKVAAQPIAANVDVAFVVTSANLDLNERRLERYLTTVQDGGAAPVVVLNKLDLVSDPAPLVARLAEVAPGVPVVAASATTGVGVDLVRAHLGPGRTGVVVGSSGVGKSTLLNQLLGAAVQDVRPVRADDDRGRHTTTRRELFVLDGGGVLIDTPGMRELKPWTDRDPAGGDADALAFDEIAALARSCRFGDCEHGAEPGCAVRAAAAAGEVAADRLDAWRKLRAEQRHEADRRDAAARLDDKRRGKIGARALRERLKDKGRRD